MKMATSSGSIRMPAPPDRRNRRRCARGTRLLGFLSSLAADSLDDERRTLSGKKGETRGELWTKRRWGKVREGVEGVSVALFDVLGRPGNSWASRWRPRRARPLQRAALARGEEDDRRGCGLGCQIGKLGRGGPGKWAASVFFF